MIYRKLRSFFGCMLILLAHLLSSPAAYARNYLVNYEAKAMHKGEVELEYWMDYIVKDRHNSEFNEMKHTLEVEYGVTDYLKLAVYGDLHDYPDKPTRYTTTRFESIYSPFKPGEQPIDVALYLEYKLAAERDDNDVFESKLLLTKAIDKFSATANLKFFEKELTSGTDVEFGYTWGARYEVLDGVNLGVEMKGSFGDDHKFGIRSGQKHYLIPGVYVKLSPHFKINFGPGIGLTDESDDLQIKSIMQYEF